jgi:hypothetical protein
MVCDYTIKTFYVWCFDSLAPLWYQNFVSVQGKNLKRLQTYTIFVLNCLTISLTYSLMSWIIVSLRRVQSYFKLFLCVACLNPSDSFYASNKEKLIRLAFFFYFNEFSIMNLMVLGDLKVYMLSTTSYCKFFYFKNIFKLISFDMS